MKTKIIISIVLLSTIIVVLAGKTFPDPWNVYATDGKRTGSAIGVGGDLSTFAITSTYKSAFLTTISKSDVIGNLSGKTLSATIYITVTGNPVFTYGLQGTQMNQCPRAANVRFYFTTNQKPFNLSNSQNNETEYWWSNPVSIDLSQLVNSTVVITVPFDPAQWSDANGHLGSNSVYTPGFNAAVANIQQIGLGFGGGCFFDVGVGIATGTGSATFHLLDYTAQ